MKTQYAVETCTFHGPTRQRRWHRVHTDPSLMECDAYVCSTIANSTPTGVLSVPWIFSAFVA